jgi:hypothetical protein
MANRNGASAMDMTPRASFFIWVSMKSRQRSARLSHGPYLGNISLYGH